MHNELAKAVAYHIASFITSELIDDVDDTRIAEAVGAELPGLEDTASVEREVRDELGRLKEFLKMRF